MKKSKIQMTNRGRKGKPVWYVEEEQADGSLKYLYSHRVKYMAECFMKQMRQLERKYPDNFVVN